MREGVRDRIERGELDWNEVDYDLESCWTHGEDGDDEEGDVSEDEDEGFDEEDKRNVDGKLIKAEFQDSVIS